MTITEKRYGLAVGELFVYNYQYWRDWEDEDVKKTLTTVMVSGLYKEQYSNRYNYKLMIVGDCPNEWMREDFSVRCSEFGRYTRPLVNDVGASAPAASVCANAVPPQGV